MIDAIARAGSFNGIRDDKEYIHVPDSSESLLRPPQLNLYFVAGEHPAEAVFVEFLRGAVEIDECTECAPDGVAQIKWTRRLEPQTYVDKSKMMLRARGRWKEQVCSGSKAVI